MKIIKKGKELNCVERIKCGNCEAELEIVRKDLIKAEDEPGRPTLYTCKCACCDETLFFTRSELPKIFKN